MYFKASLDNLAKFITLFCLILFIGIGYLNIHSAVKSHNTTNGLIIKVCVTVFLFSVFFLCFLLGPKGYYLDQHSLTVVRGMKSFSIFLADIQSAGLIKPSDLSFMTRTFAVGGLFGYFGSYYSSALGRLYLYTTQRKNRILITTRNGLKLVISPDDLKLLTDLQAGLNSPL